MKVTILKVTRSILKSGEVAYRAQVLGEVLEFGDVMPSSFSVSLEPAQFEQLKGFEGKTVELDLIFPKPNFPVKLKKVKG